MKENLLDAKLINLNIQASDNVDAINQLGKMLDASMEMYEIAYRYAVTQDVTDEEVERLSELQEEIASYAEAADGFDEVLNRIMGNTEE